MTLGFLLGILVPWAIGALALRIVWPVASAPFAIHALRSALGFFLGAGLTSLVALAMLEFAGKLDHRLPILEMALLAGLALVSLLRSVRPDPRGTTSDGLSIFAGTLAVAVGTLALLVIQARIRANPFGGPEALAIWNEHARFLFHGGTAWRAGFTEFGVGADRAPPMFGAFVAQLWCWVGGPDPRATATLGALASALTGVATFGALGALRGPLLGWIGLLAWLGSANAFAQASAQSANLTLSALVLGAVASLALLRARPEKRGLAVLAGVFASLAVWTRSEAVVVALAIAFVALVGAWRHFVFFALGALPFGLASAWFEFAVSPVPDLLGPLAAVDWGARLNDVDRIVAVGGEQASHWVFARPRVPDERWLAIGPLPVLASAALLGIAFTRRGERKEATTVLAIFVLGLLAHLTLRLALPQDLGWFALASSERIAVTALPLAILAFGLCLPGTRPPRHAPAARRSFSISESMSSVMSPVG